MLCTLLLHAKQEAQIFFLTFAYRSAPDFFSEKVEASDFIFCVQLRLWEWKSKTTLGPKLAEFELGSLSTPNILVIYLTVFFDAALRRDKKLNFCTSKRFIKNVNCPNGITISLLDAVTITTLSNGLMSHLTHYRSLRGPFYRSDEPTNSLIHCRLALKVN